MGIRIQNDTVFSNPETGMVLDQGDMVKTNEDSFAEISINGKGIMFVEENSTFFIGDLGVTKSWFTLGAGTLVVTLKKLLKPKEEIHIRTKTAVAAIRGPELAVETENDEITHAGLFEGTVEEFSVREGV